MQKGKRTRLGSSEWCTIREFDDGEERAPLPKYEAKFVEDVGKSFVDDDLVLVKESTAFGGERIYHLPRDVLEGIVERLDG